MEYPEPSTQGTVETQKGLQPEYVPFGAEWHKEVMRTPKTFIIDMLRTACMDSRRLDWLEENIDAGIWYDAGFYTGNQGPFKTGREAIDAAMGEPTDTAADSVPQQLSPDSGSSNPRDSIP